MVRELLSTPEFARTAAPLEEVRLLIGHLLGMTFRPALDEDALAVLSFTRSYVNAPATTHRVEVPALTVPRCGNCQALSIDDEADQQISAACRRVAGLLTPEESRQGREKLGLTQKQFANLLGVGEATVSRWETGAQIQQRAMDRFLRVCCASPAAVELLRSDFQASAAGVAD